LIRLIVLRPYTITFTHAAVQPVPRFAVQMHDRNNHQSIRPDLKKDAERKGVGETTSHFAVNFRKQQRIDRNAGRGILHDRQKALTQIGLLSFIPRGRVNHFSLGLWVEA
jgi:hypothetical protein